MRPYSGRILLADGQMTELIRTRNTALQQAWLQSPCNVLYELSKARPGQNIHLEIGGAIFPVIQKAATARTILRNREGRYTKYFGRYADLFGESRLTVPDSNWRQLRDLSQPHIAATDPDWLTRVTQKTFNRVADNLITESAGSSVLIDRQIDLAAASVISEVVLGFPIADWGPATIDDIRKILKLAAWENFPTVGMFGVEHSMLMLDAEDAKAALQMRFRDMIENRGDPDAPTLVNALANADAEVVDHFGELSTLLFAGFDTTASAISWAMMLLARDKSLQADLRRQVAGMADAANLTAADVMSVSDLGAFLLEALRIFPPIPILSRIATVDDNIDGVAIKANTRVLISIIGVHHDAAIFPAPFGVDISRHPNGDLTRDAAPNFLPFGDGKRICPGARIANIEAATALAVMLDKAQLDPVPSRSLDLRWEASMRQADGTHLALHRAAR